MVFCQNIANPGRSVLKFMTPQIVCSKPPTGLFGSSPVSKNAIRVPPAIKPCGQKGKGIRRILFSRTLDPRLENVVDQKMSRDIYPIGEKAGELTAQAAEWTGLKVRHGGGDCQC